MTATTTPIDRAAADKIIDEYQLLRARCYRAAQANNGELMGKSAWLRNAMSETEMELAFGPAGIDIHGSTYTMQTMSNEWFDFFLTFEDLERF